MPDAPEIHRGSEVTRLARAIESPTDRLSICAVSGPGGVGKSYLLHHVLERVAPASRGYLTLSVDGSNRASRGDFFGLVDAQLLPRSLPAPARRGRDYFPQVRKVASLHRALVGAVSRELDGAPPPLKDAAVALLRAGHLLNKLSRKSRGYLDVSALHVSDASVRDSLDVAWDAVASLRALRESSALPGPLRDLLGITLRERVGRDLYNVTADALLTDLSALLVGYRKQDWATLTHDPVDGFSRLLLIVDDFEAVAPVLEEFLVGSLVPRLAEAQFQTVMVVLGRDDLDAMHPAWAQHCGRHLRDQIRLAPFGRDDAFALLEEAGVAPERREGFYQSTQGFPFLLHLLVEEAGAEGADSALFLRKFYDRTTRWMSEREAQWFVRVCYLDAVNEDTLPRLFPAAEVARVQDWFEHEASIRDPAAPVFRVRPIIREKVLQYQELRAPARHRELLALAAG